ncbi:hypothetical protein D3C86_1648910 [compost metagenome]
MISPITHKYINSLRLIKKSFGFELIPLEELQKFVLKVINFGVGSEELPALGELVAELELNEIHDATEPFSTLAHNFMYDGLDDMFDDGAVFTNGDDYSAACKQLEHMIQDKFTSWQITPTNAMIDEIVDAFDVRERMRNYFEDADQHYISPRVEPNQLETMSIDDLFSRDR